MKRSAWTMLVTCTLALSLGGCASLSDFAIDPGEWFAGDWFSNKKKLPGERKPVFPDGVPGVSRGIPPDLVKGYQAPADADQDDPLARQAAVEEPPKPKPKAKPKPKPKLAAKPAPVETESRPTPVTVRRSDAPPGQQPPAAGQWPDPTPSRGQQPGAGAWPDPPPPGAQSGAVQWPDPPPTR